MHPQVICQQLVYYKLASNEQSRSKIHFAREICQYRNTAVAIYMYIYMNSNFIQLGPAYMYI